MPSALWKSGISPHPTLPAQGAVADSIVNPTEPEVDTPPVVETTMMDSVDNKIEEAKVESSEPQVEIAQENKAVKATRKSKR